MQSPAAASRARRHTGFSLPTNVFRGSAAMSISVFRAKPGKWKRPYHRNEEKIFYPDRRSITEINPKSEIRNNNRASNKWVGDSVLIGNRSPPLPPVFRALGRRP